MQHVICLTTAFKDPSKYKDFSIVHLMNAKKEFLKISYADFRKAFEMCINPESKGGFGIIGKFALDKRVKNQDQPIRFVPQLQAKIEKKEKEQSERAVSRA